MLSLAVLAGGRATRLHPLSEDTPKSLIPICGQPFIHWQLKLFAACGIRRVVICLHHLAHKIEAFIGDGSAYKIEVAYSYDGESPRGTGGALLKALPLLGDKFMVTYGDSFLPVDFGDIQQAFLSNSDPAFMTVYKNTDRRHSNNVDFKLGKVLAYDKEGGGYDYLDFGLIFMQASVFLNSPWGTNFDLGVALRDLAKSHRLSGIEVKQSFYEIGSFHGIEKFARYIERLNRDI